VSRFLCLLLLGLGLLGCAAEPPPTAQQAGARTKENAHGTLPVGVTLPASVPPEQLELIVDGHVDRAGYERSVHATVACLRTKGVKVEDPVPSSDGRFLHFSYSVVTPAGGDRVAADADAGKKYAECYLKHQSIVDDLWVRDSMPSEEQRQHAANDISRCLRQDGYDVPEGLSMPEIQARVLQLGPDKLDGTSRCLMQHQDVFVVPDDAPRDPTPAGP
jgi:hypothetical protein